MPISVHVRAALAGRRALPVPGGGRRRAVPFPSVDVRALSRGIPRSARRDELFSTGTP